MPEHDPVLDALLDLHGQTLFVDDVGHWVKFIVVRTGGTPQYPHGLSYSLTLHAPDGKRLVGFDNAHPVRERWGQDCVGIVQMIIGTGYDQLDHMITRMQLRYLRTLGRQ